MTSAQPDLFANAPVPEIFLRWFASRGWSPREHQLALLEKAREDRSALLIAPTGAGKTLAGFLPTLVELAASVGIAADQARQAAHAEAGKSALRQANTEAAQRGVWGSPFWFWGEEAYFGADRLPQFEQSLELTLAHRGAVR